MPGKAQGPRAGNGRHRFQIHPPGGVPSPLHFTCFLNKGVGVSKFCVPFQPWPLAVLRFPLVSVQPSLLPGSRQSTFHTNQMEREDVSLFLCGSSSLSLTQTAPASDVILCPSERKTAPIRCGRTPQHFPPSVGTLWLKRIFKFT